MLSISIKLKSSKKQVLVIAEDCGQVDNIITKLLPRVRMMYVEQYTVFAWLM